MDSREITFITGNPNKAAQLSQYLKLPVNHHKLDLVEIQSLDVLEITRHKVQEAFNILNTPVLVDDTALTFNSLNGLPGPFIKYFLQALTSEGICKLISHFNDKSATATVVIGYHDGQQVHLFKSDVKGMITETPKGDKGFGWDNIFIPEGSSQTRAEMNDEDREKYSPRKLALDQLAAHLSQ